MKKYSEACERNQEAIAKVLSHYLVEERDQGKNLMEMGAGSGQHAFYLGAKFSYLNWYPLDHHQNHESIIEWTKEVPNVQKPKDYFIPESPFPFANEIPTHFIYQANTFHIMPFDCVKVFINHLKTFVVPGGLAFFYGPFKVGGQFTSNSNEAFDLSLKARNKQQGIRDKEEILSLMEQAGFRYLEDHQMPANNQLLVFSKLP